MNEEEITKRYNGIKVEDLKRIPEVSYYNNNYYIGINGDLIFIKSSDESEGEEWYLVADGNFHCIGESFINKCYNPYFGGFT